MIEQEQIEEQYREKHQCLVCETCAYDRGFSAGTAKLEKMRRAFEKITPFLDDDWPPHISRESVASFAITEGYADAIEAVRDALKAGK